MASGPVLRPPELVTTSYATTKYAQLLGIALQNKNPHLLA
jgi:hypothetical protein